MRHRRKVEEHAAHDGLSKSSEIGHGTDSQTYSSLPDIVVSILPMGFPDHRKYCTILLKVGNVLAAEYRRYTIEVDSNNILAMIGRAAYYCALAFHRAFKLGGNVLPPGCRAARDLDGLSFTRSFETCPTQSKSSNSYAC